MGCCEGMCTCGAAGLLHCPSQPWPCVNFNSAVAPAACPWPPKSVCLLELMLVGCVIESAGQSWFLQPLLICSMQAASMPCVRFFGWCPTLCEHP